MVGKSLGPYEILEPLGAGGMGEVYLAEDTRLGRKVAIKVLPQESASDPERRARFEQEARAAAALNHPHIAAVHDVGAEGNTHYIVQEWLQGETLRSAVDKGALPLSRALELGAEIGEALAAAHAAAIVHRDLKPENIFVTEQGHAKVLDFGLAKLTELGVAPSSGASLSPTVLGTMTGTIMGTAGYMSPEQVKGEEIDRRTDVFAFGCVLYEMVTGTRAFAGDTIHHTLHRIVAEEPDAMIETRAELPLRLQWLVEKCLAKDPARRYQSADDLVVDLRALSAEVESGTARAVGSMSQAESGVAAQAPSWRQALPTRIAGAIAVGLVLITVLLTSLVARPAAGPPAGLIRFDIELAADTAFTNTNQQVLAISPDGKRVAYGATEQLWMRVLDEREAVPLRNTTEARTPFFSPDSQQLGFWADGQIKRIAVTGGAPVSLAPSGRPFGASWSTDGNIYFGVATEGISRVPESGGAPEVVVPREGDELLYGPQLLPGGEWLLFTVAVGPRAWNDAGIVAQSLTSGERRELVSGGRTGRYVPTGHLVYVRDGVLYGVPFDAAAVEVTGGPVSLVEGVRRSTVNTTGAAFFDFDAAGSLVYIPGRSGGNDGVSLVWLRRDGNIEPLPFPPRDFGAMRLSPDGERIAVRVAEDQAHIWIYEVERGGSQRLTREGDHDYPVWSPDGQWIYFETDRTGTSEIWRRRADLSGDAEPVVQGETRVFPYSISSDGSRLLYVEEPDDPTVRNIWMVALDDETDPIPLVTNKGASRFPVFSPDGRFFAYDSSETGNFQIYVMEIATGRRWPVSTAGGQSPVWPSASDEILYGRGGRTWAVPVDTTSDFEAGIPVEVGISTTIYSDATADGQRILMRRASGSVDVPGTTPHIRVVLNWFEDLRRRIPTGR